MGSTGAATADGAAAASPEWTAGMQLMSAIVGCAAVGTVMWSEFVLKDTGEGIHRQTRSDSCMMLSDWCCGCYEVGPGLQCQCPLLHLLCFMCCGVPADEYRRGRPHASGLLKCLVMVLHGIPICPHCMPLQAGA
jgi:hypothetical protein